MAHGSGKKTPTGAVAKATKKPETPALTFAENERVLCYEPDFTKVRVIYDAKILKIDWVPVDGAQVQTQQEDSPQQQGPPSSKKAKRQTAKQPPQLRQRFLVHFQGWNDKWDRYVPQSYLLKDLPENRAKQQELLQQADELTKGKKKKKKRRPDDDLASECAGDTDSNHSRSAVPSPEPSRHRRVSGASVTTGRPGTPQQQLLTPQAALPATAVAPSPTPSAAQQTSHLQKSTRGKHLEGAGQILPGEIPIRLPEGLKQCLVQDFHNNNEELSQPKSLASHGKFLLPSSSGLSCVTVLEDYVRHYANAQLLAYEKQRSKNLYTAHKKETKLYFDKALDSISLAKEVAEGLRIMLDFYVEKHLLYDSERKSFHAATERATEMHETAVADNQTLNSRERRKSQKSSTDTSATSGGPSVSFASGSNFGGTASTAGDPTGQAFPESSKDSVVSGNSSIQLPSLLTPPGSTPTTPQSLKVLRSVHDWKLFPEDRRQSHEFAHLPSFLCSPVYILRLFVKMPEILFKMNAPTRNCKLIVKYMDSVLEYLDSNLDLFA